MFWSKRKWKTVAVDTGIIKSELTQLNTTIITSSRFEADEY